MILGQAGAAEFNATHSMNWLFVTVMIVGVLFVGIISFVALILRHLRNSRQLLHSERMRSIEMGMPIEQPETVNMQARYLHNTFWIAFWMVFGVPIAAFWGAGTASARTGNQYGLGVVIWLGAAAASVAAVICATILMIITRTRSEIVLPSQKMPSKP